MSFLASLTPEARDELRSFVQEAVRETLAARERTEARQEWLTSEQAAEMLGTSENAVRCRLRRGWLAGDATKDAKRWLIRRSALLDHLDRKAGL